MRSTVPVLAPLLRSDAQGRLLAELYLNPGDELTATELAKRADTSLANASRELNRMLAAGFLRSRVSGRNRYLRVNLEHPLHRPVEQILRYAYGAIAVLSPLLSSIAGIEEAYIYGSWAARHAGEPGPDPADIDVLVIGSDVDRDQLAEAAESGRQALRREVNTRVVAPEAWAAPVDLFLRHVKERPLVPLGLATVSG